MFYVTANIADLRSLYFGGGADAEYDFLEDAAAAGVTASGLLIGANRSPLRPTNSLAETCTRTEATTNGAVLSTGRLSLVAIGLPAGMTVTSISFVAATTAAGTPTNQWFGLFDSDRVALAFTSNDTTTAWAARAVKTLTLTAPYEITTTGLYYLGIMVTATTVPTLTVNPMLHADTANVPPIATGTSTTGLTTVPTLPRAAETAITANLNRPWAWVS